jgi:hypothetical protein
MSTVYEEFMTSSVKLSEEEIREESMRLSKSGEISTKIQVISGVHPDELKKTKKELFGEI